MCRRREPRRALLAFAHCTHLTDNWALYGVNVEELSYRFRTAGPEDLPQLRQLSWSTVAHPEGRAKRESYRAAVQRGELLVLERMDHKHRDWNVSAFVDWHMRVDDVLTIRDAGTEGEVPHSGMVKQLMMELISSLSPTEITLKTRADVPHWNDIIYSIPGFELEGSEYRRPYWINVWRWTRELAAAAARAGRGPRPRR